MSKFVTKVPVEVDTVIKLLPKKSDIEGVNLSEDGKSIEIHWGNDWMRTPFAVEIEWPVNLLRAKKPPAQVEEVQVSVSDVQANGTPKKSAPVPLCGARYGAYKCKLPKGHAGRHHTERGMESGTPFDGVAAKPVTLREEGLDNEPEMVDKVGK